MLHSKHGDIHCRLLHNPSHKNIRESSGELFHWFSVVNTFIWEVLTSDIFSCSSIFRRQLVQGVLLASDQWVVPELLNGIYGAPTTLSLSLSCFRWFLFLSYSKIRPHAEHLHRGLSFILLKLNILLSKQELSVCSLDADSFRHSYVIETLRSWGDFLYLNRPFLWDTVLQTQHSCPFICSSEEICSSKSLIWADKVKSICDDVFKSTSDRRDSDYRRFRVSLPWKSPLSLL